MGIFNFFKKDNSKLQKLQYLANLFYMAMSDGNLHDSEQKKIDEIREKMGISTSEYNDLVRSIVNGSYAKSRILSPASDDEAWEHLQDIAALSAQDGQINDEEIEILKKISVTMGYDENNSLVKALQLAKESLSSNNENKKKETKNIQRSEQQNANRINMDELEDIGIVSHYKGNPFTGIAFQLYENGDLFEEIEMLNGLRHGKQVLYFKDSTVHSISFYENDLLIDHNDKTYDGLTKEIFPNEDYVDLNEIYSEIHALLRSYISADEKNDIKQYSQKYFEIFPKKIVDSMLRLKKLPEKSLEAYESSFFKGWTLNEIKYSFLYAQTIFNFFPNTGEKEDNYRQKAIIGFSQMCYMNTLQINSIGDSSDWIDFATQMLEEKLDKEKLTVLMEMNHSKKIELLFILKTLINYSTDLVKKSNNEISGDKEEMNLIISNMNNFFYNTEKMFTVSFSNEDFTNTFQKYCDEDDKFNQNK